MVSLTAIYTSNRFSNFENKFSVHILNKQLLPYIFVHELAISLTCSILVVEMLSGIRAQNEMNSKISGNESLKFHSNELNRTLAPCEIFFFQEIYVHS